MFYERFIFNSPKFETTKCLPTSEWLNYDEYVHYLGDDFQLHTYAKTYQIIQFKYVQFIACQLCISKVLQKQFILR